MARWIRFFAILLIAVWGTVVWVLADGGTKIPPGLKREANESAARGMGGERVEVRAADGVRLVGWGFPAKDDSSKGAVIVLHGIGSSRSDMLGFARIFAQDGYAVLTPDLRGHGESEGAMVTYGVLEKADVRQWAAWAKHKWAAKRVVAFGESLGGSVALEALGDLDGAIAECAYAEFPQVAAERVALQLPLPPTLLRYVIVAPAIGWVRVSKGIDLSAASAIESVKRNRKPVFLIHGLKDELTPIEHSRRLRAVAPERVTLWEVPGAVHVGAYGQDEREFERRVRGWMGAQFPAP